MLMVFQLIFPHVQPGLLCMGHLGMYESREKVEQVYSNSSHLRGGILGL